MKRQYRQGDILLDEAVPRPQLSLAKAQGTDLVLAVGERTGHAHRIQCTDALLSNLLGQVRRICASMFSAKAFRSSSLHRKVSSRYSDSGNSNLYVV